VRTKGLLTVGLVSDTSTSLRPATEAGVECGTISLQHCRLLVIPHARSDETTAGQIPLCRSAKKLAVLDFYRTVARSTGEQR
jgi:hypothetical protein